MFGVIGTTTADLFILGAERMPQLDRDEFTASNLVFCDRELTITLGGNGANSAYVLRALGAPVTLCSATGTNAIGELVTRWLAEQGVDLRGFLRRDGGTATTTSAIDADLRRVSFYYPGIFSTFDETDLPAALWHDAHTLLVTGHPLLPGFRGGGFAKTLHNARQRGITTALDIGPAIQAPATFEMLAPLLPALDYLLTNAYELAIATGTDDLEAGAAQLQQAGATCVVVKLGKDGAFIRTADEADYVVGFPVQASVTIGAGDSFNAGLLYARHAGMAFSEAVRFANAVAALVVQSGKSVLGAPDPAQVRALLDRHAEV